jgi:hypothetical protein
MLAMAQILRVEAGGYEGVDHRVGLGRRGVNLVLFARACEPTWRLRGDLDDGLSRLLRNRGFGRGRDTPFAPILVGIGLGHAGFSDR